MKALIAIGMLAIVLVVSGCVTPADFGYKGYAVCGVTDTLQACSVNVPVNMGNNIDVTQMFIDYNDPTRPRADCHGAEVEISGYLCSDLYGVSGACDNCYIGTECNIRSSIATVFEEDSTVCVVTNNLGVTGTYNLADRHWGYDIRLLESVTIIDEPVDTYEPPVTEPPVTQPPVTTVPPTITQPSNIFDSIMAWLNHMINSILGVFQ